MQVWAHPTTLARPLLTLARRLGLHRLLPLDLHVSYHKATGVLVALLATIHTAAHIHNMATNLLVQPEQFLRRNRIPHDPKADLASLSLAAWLFTPLPGVFGLLPGLALPSGLLLLLALSVLLVGALPVVRSSGHFEVPHSTHRPTLQVFYWTHLCYLAILGLLVVHAPSCLYYLGPPALLLLLGKLLLLCSALYRRTSTTALSLTALPSQVSSPGAPASR